MWAYVGWSAGKLGHGWQCCVTCAMLAKLGLLAGTLRKCCATSSTSSHAGNLDIPLSRKHSCRQSKSRLSAFVDNSKVHSATPPFAMSGAATSDLPIPELNVTTVRVVAHLVSPLVPGGQVSQNHWSIYLVISSGGSVRLNMEWVSGTAGDEGTFTVKRHFYATSKTAIRVFDYDVPPGTKVESFLGIVREKKRHSYNMTPTGAGCRFWV